MSRIVGKTFEDNGLSSKSKKELLKMAAEASLDVSEKMSKAELIELIENAGGADDC